MFPPGIKAIKTNPLKWPSPKSGYPAHNFQEAFLEVGSPNKVGNPRRSSKGLLLPRRGSLFETVIRYNLDEIFSRSHKIWANVGNSPHIHLWLSCFQCIVFQCPTSFPNFFFITGPNLTLNLWSILFFQGWPQTELNEDICEHGCLQNWWTFLRLALYSFGFLSTLNCRV